jgi:hypothetical protein
MEQDRFDELAKKVFDGTSRRRVVGGAIASVVGAGVAAVTGVSAKNDKKAKAKAQGKKSKGRAQGEFTCTTGNANNPAQGGCADPTSCCLSNSADNATCVPATAQLGTSTCGTNNNGSGVCNTCPAGTVCGLRGNDRVCVATPASCPNGCIIPGGTNQNDQCVPNGNAAPVNSSNPQFDGRFVCGTGGSTCEVCSFTGGLQNTGCCTAAGRCNAGTTAAQCGSQGALCQTCTTLGPNATCTSQTCVGGTTTAGPTTTAAPTTTTIAPCPIAKNGKQKVRCGTNCCGRKQECKTSKDGTQHCKRKKRFL